jgi:predicted membrane protein
MSWEVLFNMHRRWFTYAIFFGLPFLLLTFLGAVLLLGLGSGHREILRTTEKELAVKLEAAFGKLYVSRGDSKKICTIDIKNTDTDKPRGTINYTIRDGVGKLDIDLNKFGESESGTDAKRHLDLGELESGKWYIRLTDQIPISFNVELGVGKGDFDCSGLLIKDFVLSTGASSVNLRFPQRNKAQIDNMKIETGVSKFVGEGLGNANFRNFQFSGGVGSYTLDFSGELKQEEVDVKVEVGLGSVTILVPPDVGARVFYQESWVSKIDLDRDFEEKRDGQYFSDNYGTASSRMNISVESGLGHVKIEHKNP